MDTELTYSIVWYGQPKGTRQAFERSKKRNAKCTQAEKRYRYWLADQMTFEYNDEPMTQAVIKLSVASNRSFRLDTVATNVINAMRVGGVLASEKAPDVARIELTRIEGEPRIELDVTGYAASA